MFQGDNGEVRATLHTGQEDGQEKYDNHTVTFGEQVRRGQWVQPAW